jgi:hypothetical protein
VRSAASGWDVIEEEDSIVVVRVHRDDWHRVERDFLLFDLKIVEFERAGWTAWPIRRIAA